MSNIDTPITHGSGLSIAEGNLPSINLSTIMPSTSAMCNGEYFLGKIQLSDDVKLSSDEIIKIAVKHEIPKLDDTISFTEENLIVFAHALINAQLEKTCK